MHFVVKLISLYTMVTWAVTSFLLTQLFCHETLLPSCMCMIVNQAAAISSPSRVTPSKAICPTNQIAVAGAAAAAVVASSCLDNLQPAV